MKKENKDVANSSKKSDVCLMLKMGEVLWLRPVRPSTSQASEPDTMSMYVSESSFKKLIPMMCPSEIAFLLYSPSA